MQYYHAKQKSVIFYFSSFVKFYEIQNVNNPANIRVNIYVHFYGDVACTNISLFKNSIVL